MVKNIYFTLIFAFSLSNSFSQSGRSLLEVKKKRFQKKIELASKILRQTKEQKKSTVEDIKNFDLEINIQEQKMQLSNEEMSVIEKEMVIINQNVANQDAKLSQLRKQYAKILFENSKRNTNLSKLGFLLSAQDFNTFFMRYKYLKQFFGQLQKRLRKAK